MDEREKRLWRATLQFRLSGLLLLIFAALGAVACCAASAWVFFTVSYWLGAVLLILTIGAILGMFII